MESTKFEITGLKETLEIFKILEDEIGDKTARSKVLIPAVKEAMKPVLNMAKALSPVDTSALKNTLTISARRPTKKDKKSKYINEGDMVVAIVTTKNIPKKLKNAFKESHADLINSASMFDKGSKNRNDLNKIISSKKRKFFAEKGMPYDARAVANEFGTANMPAKPFMRPAMESQAMTVSNSLGNIIKQKIEQYRSKSLK